MTTPNPSAPEFTEGYKAGFHEGVEQAREEFKKKPEEPKKEERKADKPEETKPRPIRQKIGALFHNRTFQIAAAAVALLVIGYFIYEATIHESTDDAYTTGHVHDIAARVTGTVLKVNVDDNERVKQGEVLVVLDPTDFEVQVAQAEANYGKAKADDERAQKLQGNGAISQQDYDQFNAALQVAKAQLKDAQDQLAYTTIVAPADGRIGHKSVETGERVTAGSALMAVVEDVWVVANFKETQLGKMRVGQSATITVDAIPGKTFRGFVDSWSPGSGSVFALLPPDNATGNFTKIVQRVPVKIRFDQDSIRGYEQRIVPGLSCEPEVLLRGGEANSSSPVNPQLESIPPDAGR
ncbi:MAG TPA: HlyD family secretion protein [Candidatus Methylacidiphilales bacterium]|jgi:membrane fusion protein (multidrug efflux system)|nr:HlyD family secretion protein [Candidatus Methylacidiphilales bacterium]